jgi:alpha-ribazole phosphatase
MAVKLFLIRHGQTLWNQEGRYQGDRDIDLTEEGMRQARLTADYLSDVDFSAIYSSPLKRAVDTANIINEANKGKNLKIIIRDNLKEMHFGTWEGMKFEQLGKVYRKEFRQWLSDPYNYCPTGGESFKQVKERSIKEIENIVKENENGSNVAVVTHGGVILSILVYWLQIPLPRWRSIILHQGAINIAVVDRGFPYISTINFTGHLNPIYDDSGDKIIKTYSRFRSDDGKSG